MGWLNPCFSCGAQYDNFIFASACKFNGLVKVDIKSGDTKYIMPFPGENEVIKNQHSKAVVFNGEIYFFPATGKFIHVFNVKENNIRNIDLDKNEHRGEYYTTIYEDGVIIIPKKAGEDILKYSFGNTEVSVLISWTDLSKYIPVNSSYLFLRTVAYEKKLYLPVLETCHMLSVDLDTLVIETIEVQVDKLLGAFGGDGEVLLLSNDSPALYKWNPVENKIISCELDSKINHNSRFTFAIQLNKKHYLFPAYSSPFIGIEENGKVKVFMEMQKSSNKLMFMEPFVNENVIWALPYDSGLLLQISEDGVFEKVLGNIEMDDSIKEKIFESRIKAEELLIEDDDTCLTDLMNWIIKQ